MSVLVQGVLLGPLLKRFSPQRLAVVGLVVVDARLPRLWAWPRRAG